jgi:hypothetical protein
MAHMMSLLDPVAFKSYLTFVLQLPSVDGKAGFESSNGVDLFTGSLFGAWYAQNKSSPMLSASATSLFPMTLCAVLMIVGATMQL